MYKPKKKTLIGLLVVFLLTVSSVLYFLADRYLIEHVEITNVSAAVAETTVADLPQVTSVVENVSLDTPATIFADDWNYQSDAFTISINEVTSGSGQNALTYFVADVVVSDATQLTSAFADNSFGENIVEYTSQIADENNAIFAINGDYYGFRSDGIVIRNGVIYRDIPARTGLAFYQDGSMKIYDETQSSAQKLLDEGVWNTLSFGPALLENSVIATNLEYVEVDTNFGNHSIQGSNPRTGVGIIDNNHFVFIVVDGRSPGYSTGVTLTEFAQIFKDLGCSTMYFMGRVVNNPLGKNRERGTSDILFIG